MNNHIILKGNVTQPPYFDHVGDTGRPFLRLYLAVDRPRDSRTDAEREPDFFRIVAYDDQALFSFSYLRPNSGLLIVGRLRARKRRLRGGKRETVVEVVADDITFLSKINWEAGDAARERILAERAGQEETA